MRHIDRHYWFEGQRKKPLAKDFRRPLDTEKDEKMDLHPLWKPSEMAALCSYLGLSTVSEGQFWISGLQKYKVIDVNDYILLSYIDWQLAVANGERR